MNRRTLARLEALEAARGGKGMRLAAALGLVRELREQRAIFPTAEAWLAYRRFRTADSTLVPELSAAIREVRERRNTPLPSWEERERKAWRSERARYLAANPREVRP